jgi:hypothetical protein
MKFHTLKKTAISGLILETRVRETVITIWYHQVVAIAVLPA